MTTTTTTTSPVVTDEPKALSFEIAGEGLGLLRTDVKAGTHAFYAFRVTDKASMYGVPVTAMADSLPTYVVVDGVKVDLTVGLTGKDGETDRRAKRSYHGPVTLPSLPGVRQANITVSETKNGGWNIKATITRQPSASPEKQAEKQAANLEALKALFA